MMVTPAEYEIAIFANALLRKHGLAEKGWKITWDRAVKRAGQCRYSTRTLSFSRPLLKTRGVEATKMTVLHEVAHALTEGASHGPRWKRKFIELGGDGKRKVVPPPGVHLPTRYIGTCTRNGEHKFFRQRMTKQILAGSSCSKCNPRSYDSRCELRWIDTKTGRNATLSVAA